MIKSKILETCKKTNVGMSGILATFAALALIVFSGTVGVADELPLDVRLGDCTTPEWSADSGMDASGMFAGTVSSLCEIIPSGNGDLANLREFVKGEIREQSTDIHEGPIAEIFEGMNSERFNVTLDIEDQDDIITVLQDMHVATDLLDKFVLATQSSEVHGQGLSSFVKELRSHLELNRMNNNHFKMDFRNFSRVKKPWFISASEFIKMVKSRVSESFVRKRSEAVEKFSKNL